MPILEIAYHGAARWAHPIRAAIQANPALAQRDKAWRESRLSDYAFAIETRLTYLPQIITRHRRQRRGIGFGASPMGGGEQVCKPRARLPAPKYESC
jgi:hypothetical protein